MKKSGTLTLSLLLGALLLGSMASCGESTVATGKQETDAPQTLAIETEAVTENPILDAIPADTDFGGMDIRIYINEYDQTQFGSDMFMKGPDESDGDVVHDAILERNQAVEERLNVNFTYNIESYAYDKVYNNIQKLVIAGDDIYDLIIDQQYGMLKVATANMLYNFMDSNVFDFSQNYWWEEYMEQLQVGLDTRYLLAGDYFLDVVETASGIFFNKNLYQASYESSDVLYELAFEGKWTIDKLGQYVKEYYYDINGDGKVDTEDRFSMNLSRNFMDATVFSSGITFMTRGEDGLPVLQLGQDSIANLMTIIKTSYFEPKTTYNFATANTGEEAEYYRAQRVCFAAGQMLFLNDYIAAVKDLRDMKDDYGILPMPKMDESVDTYRSVSHDTALVGGIPTTCGQTETVCTVLEALCSMSHNTSMKTYFETAMKVKYARDESSSRMIDLLHDSITSSFCYAYASQISDYHEIFRTLFDSGKDTYASSYAKKEKTINKNFAKLITAYEEAQQNS